MQAAVRRGLSVLARSIAFAWCLGVAITGHGSMRVVAAVMLLAIAAEATCFVREDLRPRVKRRRARESDLGHRPKPFRRPFCRSKGPFERVGRWLAVPINGSSP